MIHLDANFAQQVETAVTRIEERTDAELVVVAAQRSGSYRDLAMGVGIAAGMLSLVFVLFSSWDFSPTWIPLEVLLIGAAAAWWAGESTRIVRLLSRRFRRTAQVQEAGQQAFVEENVHGTRGRTGILVYLSVLENRVFLLPDLGIDGRVPKSAWNEIRWGSGVDRQAPDDLASFLAGLEAMGAVLAARVPPGDDNPDELPNRPRIR